MPTYICICCLTYIAHEHIDVISKGKESDWRPPGWVARARFLSLAWSKFRLCSANHRPGYWSNLTCDWPSTVWAYSGQETENGPRIRTQEPSPQQDAYNQAYTHACMQYMSAFVHSVLYCMSIYIHCISLTQLIKSRQNSDHISWPNWKGNVIILMKLSVLAVPDAVKLTTFYAVSDGNFAKMKIKSIWVFTAHCIDPPATNRTMWQLMYWHQGCCWCGT